MNFAIYFNAFFELLKTDLNIFKQNLKDRYIDVFIWVSTVALVTAYLMPYFGTDEYFTTFMIAGLSSSAGLFQVFPSVFSLISDFETANITAFYLTLPMPSFLVFLRSILYYAIDSAVMSIFVLPVCKLLVWNFFDLSNFNLLKFIIIFIITNLFFGVFTLFAASMTPAAQKIGRIWSRMIYPLWFLGGFQFSWYALHNVSPILSYLDLLNPIIYVTEGIRSAVLGQSKFLPFWLSCLMLIIFMLILGCYSFKRLKKRLDYI